MKRTVGAELARLVLAAWALSAADLHGQAEPPIEPSAETPGATDANAGWRWRPSLFLLGAWERDRSLAAVEGAEAGQPFQELEPALALGIEADRAGARGGFQAEASLLGRAPFDGDTRSILFDGRAHAFRTLGAAWRVGFDEGLRLERLGAQRSGDFQRQQATLTLERQSQQGPAWRLQISDRRLGLPDARALDVRQNVLALGAVSSLGTAASLETKAFLRRFAGEAQLRTQAGVALEVARVRADGVLALRYQFAAALDSPGSSETLGPNGAPSELSGVDASAVFTATAGSEPPATRVAGNPPEELPDVPLADALDDDGDSWPARQEHVVSVYGSRRLGQRLRLVVRWQVRWLQAREPLAPDQQSFDHRRWHVRATVRWRLSTRTALIAQAAHASERGSAALGAQTRSQVFFGVQLR